MGEFFYAIDLEQIPRISLGTAALLIFGAIASLSILRGLLRIIWGTVVVCVSGYAAFVSWQHSAELTRQWLGESVTWPSMVLPAVVFLFSLLSLRALGRFIVKPLGGANEENAEKNRGSPMRWAVVVLLSLIPTVLLWFTGATMLRHVGSLAEIQDYAKSMGNRQNGGENTFLVRLKENVEAAFPRDWFQAIDPMASDARVKLAKLISVSDEPPNKAIPVLEIPEIQELVLSDDRLLQLARDGRYSEILRDPKLDRLLESDDLRAILSGLEL